MKRFDNGEIQPVEFTVHDDRTAGATVTVASATYVPLNSSGATLQASANATMTNNGTALVTIAGSVDTTTATFTDDLAFEVKFTYVIGAQTLIEHVHCLMTETKL